MWTLLITSCFHKQPWNKLGWDAHLHPGTITHTHPAADPDRFFKLLLSCGAGRPCPSSPSARHPPSLVKTGLSADAGRQTAKVSESFSLWFVFTLQSETTAYQTGATSEILHCKTKTTNQKAHLLQWFWLVCTYLLPDTTRWDWTAPPSPTVAP